MTLRGNYRKKDVNYLRKMTTGGLVNECVEAEIFDKIFWDTDYGQPGVWVYIFRGKYRITIRRESKLHGKGEGFRATNDKPTLITRLSVAIPEAQNISSPCKYLGMWDTLPLFPKHRDTFRDLEKEDPVFRGFLHDVMEIFG